MPRKGPCCIATEEMIMSSVSKALTIKLKDALDPEFVREVLERKVTDDNKPRATLLRSSASATIVRKKVLAAFSEVETFTLEDLASCSSSDVKRMAGLGSKTLRWLEEYLQLLGITFAKTRSLYGMSKEVRDFFATF